MRKGRHRGLKILAGLSLFLLGILASSSLLGVRAQDESVSPSERRARRDREAGRGPRRTEPGRGPRSARAEEKKEPPWVIGEDNQIMINFQNTDIDAILLLLSKLTQWTIVKDPEISGQVTVINPVKMSQEDAIDVLVSILELVGYTIVRSARMAKIVPVGEAKGRPIDTRLWKERGKPGFSDQIVMQMVPLKYLDAAATSGALAGLVSPSGTLFHSERSNLLFIVDAVSNIDRLVKIIEKLDVELPMGETEIELVYLKYADEETLAPILNDILAAPLEEQAPGEARRAAPQAREERGARGARGAREERGARGARGARGGRGAEREQRAVREVAQAMALKSVEKLMGKVKIIPEPRLHALIIVTIRQNIPLVKEIIDKLDVPGPEVGSATRVYFLNYAKAPELAGILADLFMGGGEARKRGREEGPGQQQKLENLPKRPLQRLHPHRLSPEDVRLGREEVAVPHLSVLWRERYR